MKPTIDPLFFGQETVRCFSKLSRNWNLLQESPSKVCAPNCRSVEMEFFEDAERVLAALLGPSDAEQSDVSPDRECATAPNLKRALVRGSDERRTNRRPRESL
mgnify:CR=1 FL=1